MCHYGYASITMEKIAKEAGLSRQIVARFFGTSDNIASLTVNHICESILTQVQDIAGTSADYTEQTDRMFEFVKRNQSELRLIISLFATPNLAPIVREAMPGLTQSMRQLVSKHNPELSEKNRVVELQHDRAVFPLCPYEPRGPVPRGQGYHF